MDLSLKQCWLYIHVFVSKQCLQRVKAYSASHTTLPASRLELHEKLGGNSWPGDQRGILYNMTPGSSIKIWGKAGRETAAQDYLGIGQLVVSNCFNLYNLSFLSFVSLSLLFCFSLLLLFLFCLYFYYLIIFISTHEFSCFNTCNSLPLSCWEDWASGYVVFRFWLGTDHNIILKNIKEGNVLYRKR